MSVRTHYFTDHKHWVDCIAETRYIYDGSNGIPRNYIDLSCRRRAKCHPDDKFSLEFGKELAKAKAFVVLNKKKLDYLYGLSRKFSKEQKEELYETALEKILKEFRKEREFPEPKPKKFISKLTKLNEEELEEIYQALQEMHRNKK